MDDTSTPPLAPFEVSDTTIIAGIVLVVAGLVFTRLKEWEAQLPTKHIRAARLAAYRVRHRWRKADGPKLREIGLSPVGERALQRAEAVRVRGRGVISRHRSHEVVMRGVSRWMYAYLSPATPPGAANSTGKQSAA